MAKYAYKLLKIKEISFIFESDLNELGKEGWQYRELIYPTFGDERYILLEQELTENVAVIEPMIPSEKCPQCEGYRMVSVGDRNTYYKQIACMYCEGKGWKNT